MKLPKLFKKKPASTNEPEVMLALDIGTEFVKAALFRINEVDNKVEILGYDRSRQSSNAMNGAMIVNLANVVKACDRSVGGALNQADQVLQKINKTPEYKTPLPDRVIMGIAGELVQGVTIMADYEREDPNAKIDDEELTEVVESIKEQAFKDAVEDIASEIGVPSDKLEEINSKINSTYIDGVKVDNPLGFTGKDVTYKVYATFAPTIHINSLKEIANQLGLQVISIEVEPYAISRAVKGSSSNQYEAVFIDVGGGTTDVAVVVGGSIMGTKMFAYGGKVFTKRLAKDLNLDLNDAEKMKIDYANGQLADTTEEKIKKIYAKDIRIWAEGVELSLAATEDVKRYPSKFYLCGGGSSLPEIKDALLQHPWLQILPFLKHPKVEFLFPKQLADIDDLTESIFKSEDIAPLALARMVLELE